MWRCRTPDSPNTKHYLRDPKLFLKSRMTLFCGSSSNCRRKGRRSVECMIRRRIGWPSPRLNSSAKKTTIQVTTRSRAAKSTPTTPSTLRPTTTTAQYRKQRTCICWPQRGKSRNKTQLVITETRWIMPTIQTSPSFKALQMRTNWREFWPNDKATTRGIFLKPFLISCRDRSSQRGIARIHRIYHYLINRLQILSRREEFKPTKGMNNKTRLKMVCQIT